MRILVVEDESTLNKTLLDGLSECGFQTDTSESYKDAEYYIGIRNYDLVLCDWMLEDGDGTDLIEVVKRKSPRTPVVILSAKDDKQSEITALKAGADDYIKKPGRRGGLSATVVISPSMLPTWWMMRSDRCRLSVRLNRLVSPCHVSRAPISSVREQASVCAIWLAGPWTTAVLYVFLTIVPVMSSLPTILSIRQASCLHT